MSFEEFVEKYKKADADIKYCVCRYLANCQRLPGSAEEPVDTGGITLASSHNPPDRQIPV